MPADAFNPHLPAGQPRRKVRDFLRDHVNWQSFLRETVIEWFGDDITDDLLANGLVEPARERVYSRTEDTTDGEVIPDAYRVSERGRRFASKLLIPPIPRAKAEQIVTEMLARADAINRNRELLCWIESITLFGSYLTDAPVVGDIDVGVNIRYKVKLVADWTSVDWNELALARANEADRQFKSYNHALEYPRDEVHRRLKARNPYLAIMTIGVNHLDGPKRIIQPTAPSPHVIGPDGTRYTSSAVIEALNGRQGRRG